MSYVIQALIAKQGTFAHIKALSDLVTVAQLNQGFELLLDDRYLISALKLENIPVQVHAELSFNQGIFDTARRLSLTTPIAYVWAEFFGGAGEQWAQLWQGGEVVLTPETNYAPLGYNDGIASETLPINSVLSALGVSREGPVDEFAALGLSRYRTMSAWFEQNTSYSTKDYNSVD